MKMYLRKTSHTCFEPASEADLEAAETLPYGEELLFIIKRVRNQQFHKKFMSLLRLAYQYWEPEQIAGFPALRDFDIFREEVIKAAGYYQAYFLPGGGVKLVAQSISFGAMDEDEFARLYSKAVGVVLVMMGRYGFTEADLRDLENKVLNYV